MWVTGKNLSTLRLSAPAWQQFLVENKFGKLSFLWPKLIELPRLNSEICAGIPETKIIVKMVTL